MTTLLEAVKHEIDLVLTDPDTALSNGALRALQYVRQAIEQAEQAQPFCYHDGRNIVGKEFAEHSDVFPLYTAPPPRKPLTDEEIGQLIVFDGLHHVEVPVLADFARAIEAKLREKNGF